MFNSSGLHRVRLVCSLLQTLQPEVWIFLKSNMSSTIKFLGIQRYTVATCMLQLKSSPIFLEATCIISVCMYMYVCVSITPPPSLLVVYRNVICCTYFCSTCSCTFIGVGARLVLSGRVSVWCWSGLKTSRLTETFVELSTRVCLIFHHTPALPEGSAVLSTFYCMWTLC